MARLRLSIFGTDSVPPADQVSVYAKSDRKLYLQDETSLEREIVLGGSINPGFQPPEVRTLTPEEATAKSVTLAAAPAAPTLTILEVVGAPPQLFGVDFSVTDNVLSWAGLGLDGLLEHGDKIRVLYC